jgi:hypothetical protein
MGAHLAVWYKQQRWLGDVSGIFSSQRWLLWLVGIFGRFECNFFEHVQPRFTVWRRNFIEDISLHSHRFKEDKKDKILSWISTLH